MPGRDIDDVAGAKQPAGDLLKRACRSVPLRDGFAFGLAKRIGLRLAAAFGHRFSEVGKQHREPQPERNLQIEPKPDTMMNRIVDKQKRGEHAADFDNKHYGILYHPARIKFTERIDKRLPHDPRIPKAFLLRNSRRCFLAPMFVVLWRQG